MDNVTARGASEAETFLMEVFAAFAAMAGGAAIIATFTAPISLLSFLS